MTLQPSEALDRARDLVLAGEHEPAIALLREYLAEHPDDATAWHRLAGALIGCDDYAAAVDAASRSIAIDPDNVAAHRFRALANDLLGRDRESYTDAERAVELAPEDHEALSLLATNVLAVNGDVTRFRELTAWALSADPDSRPARELLKAYRLIRQLNAVAALCLAVLPASFVLFFGWFAVDTGRSADAVWMTWPALISYVLTFVAIAVQRVLLRKGRSPRGLIVLGLERFHVLVAAGSAGVLTAAATYGATRSGGVAVSLGLLSGALSLLVGLLVRKRASRSRSSS